MNKKQTNNNGIVKLPQEMEEMRMKVVDLELKARYWKAQHDIRYFTLEAEKLQPEYDVYLEAQLAKEKKAYEEFMAQMEKNKEKGIDVELGEESSEALNSGEPVVITKEE